MIELVNISNMTFDSGIFGYYTNELRIVEFYKINGRVILQKIYDNEAK